jgi:hypothetical protein
MARKTQIQSTKRLVRRRWRLWLQLGFLVALILLLLASACGLGTPTPESRREVPVDQPEPEEPAASEPEEPVVYVSEDGRVTVFVPWQGYPVYINELPIDEVPPGYDEFGPIRPVIDFEVRTVDGNELVRTLDPPMDIEVHYTIEDFEMTGGQLKLGFWHEQQERWVVLGQGIWEEESQSWITEVWQALDFAMEGDPEGGVGVTKVNEWGDRFIAWGE